MNHQVDVFAQLALIVFASPYAVPSTPALEPSRHPVSQLDAKPLPQFHSGVCVHACGVEADERLEILSGRPG